MIKNIHYIKNSLDENKLHQLDKSAGLYAANAKINFKILAFDDNQLIIEVRQSKTIDGNYLTGKELSTRAKDLFARFFPDHKIHTRPKEFERPIIDIVNSSWIRWNMTEKKVKIKDIERMTGIHRSNLSNYINSDDELTQPVKGMFYFMFTNPDTYFKK